MSSRTLAAWSVGIIFAAVAGILLVTGIHSGVQFQLDQDELVHAQVAYLILHGVAPYRDFLFTYTPIFNLFIAPVFLLTGYSLHAMTVARWLMAVLFVMRVALSGWIVLKVFGKRVAALFTVFFLMDPFTMYTAMQIRPDNLMMLLATAGLALLVYAFAHPKDRYFFWAGILLSMSGLVLLKIAPTLAVIFLAVLWYGFTRRRYRSIHMFLLGCALPAALFFVFFEFSGTLQAMLQQVLRDSYAIHQAIEFPLPLTHYLEFNNPALFDLYGEAWQRFPYVEYGLMALAVAGVVWAVFPKKRTPGAPRAADPFTYVLVGSLAAQGAGLFAIHSMFIQYFLPVTWLIDLFAAWTLVRFVRLVSRWKLLSALTLIELAVLLALVTYDSARANYTRSFAVSNSTVNWLNAVWAQVPTGASVYPNIPFRPLVYPTPYGFYFHNLPASVSSRLPPLVATLEANHVEYLLDTYEWRVLPPDFYFYVDTHFHQTIPGVYLRN